MKLIEKYLGGDDILKDVHEYVTWWNKESSKDGIDRYLEELKYETRQETRREVAHEKDISTAKSLLEDKIPIKSIMKATNLSKEEILELKEAL